MSATCSSSRTPTTRLVARRNPELARLRAHKRESLLQATERNLEKVSASVSAGRLRGQDKIGVRAGKVLNQYKVAKHFELDIITPSASPPRPPSMGYTSSALR